MFRVLAISLDEKRMDAMRTIWPGVEKFPGILHSNYLGCNLAHIAAVREGLRTHDYVLVLEDDSRPKSGAEAVYSMCTNAMQFDFDVLSLCAAADFKVPSESVVARPFSKGIYAFEPSRQFVNMDAVFWSKSALPFLDEYEALLRDDRNFLPIDLMIYNNNWSIDIEGSEPCQIKYLKEIDGIKHWPPNLSWNHPRTLIAWPPLTFQSMEYVSAHTGNATPDYTESNLKLDVRLRIDPIPKRPECLNFVIGSSRQVTETECG